MTPTTKPCRHHRPVGNNGDLHHCHHPRVVLPGNVVTPDTCNSCRVRDQPLFRNRHNILKFPVDRTRNGIHNIRIARATEFSTAPFIPSADKDACDAGRCGFSIPPPSPRQPDERRRLTKTESETTRRESETHEIRETATGRSERTTTRTETVETNTTINESSGAQAPRLLPSSRGADEARENLPPQVKLEIADARRQGTNQTSPFDADFIMAEVKGPQSQAQPARSASKGLEWQVEFPTQSGLHRASLTAAPNSDGTLALCAKLAGRINGPVWRNPSVASLAGPVALTFDDSEGVTPSADTDWPRTVNLIPIFAAVPQEGHYISPEPLMAEMMLMGSGSSSSGSGSNQFVDIDIDGVADDKEFTIGGVVVKNADGNNAPRKKITLNSNITTGSVILTKGVTNKVKIFTAATNGTEITFNGTDNKFAVNTLPKSLYVEGAAESGTMRDVMLQLTHDQIAPPIDRVKFTVLWVTLSMKHAGNLANDNSAKTVIETLLVPPASSALGNILVVVGGIVPIVNQRALNARGTEFIGTLKPSNFVPSNFGGSIMLQRELAATVGNVAGRIFVGPPPNGNTTSADQMAGNDTSDAVIRDDDPQSGGSAGKIYDYDSPGLSALWTTVPNRISRFRVNFKFWASYDGTRCSLKEPWYTRQSYKLTGSTDQGRVTAATANTLTDANKTPPWANDTWKDGAVRILVGTGKGQYRAITGNTGTQITVDENWNPALDRHLSIPGIASSTASTQRNDKNEYRAIPSKKGTLSALRAVTWKML